MSLRERVEAHPSVPVSTGGATELPEGWQVFGHHGKDADEALDAATFTRWCVKRLERYKAEDVREAKLKGLQARKGAQRRLADELGLGESSIKAYLRQWDPSGRPTEFYPRWRIEEMLDSAGVALWDVYKGISDDIPRDSRGRSNVARRGTPSFIPEDHVRAAWVVHQRGGVSIREIGRQKWQEWGYASAHTAANALSSAFRHLGFDSKPNTHTVVAMSTIHGLAPRYLRPGDEGYEEWRALIREQRRARGEVRGVKCAGVRMGYPRKGDPCQLYARAGSDYCRAHDPVLREEVLATAANARAHRPTPEQEAA